MEQRVHHARERQPIREGSETGSLRRPALRARERPPVGSDPFHMCRERETIGYPIIADIFISGASKPGAKHFVDLAESGFSRRQQGSRKNHLRGGPRCGDLELG